jgi:hypothetical protein
MSLSRILLSSLLKSITGKAFQQAPEGSALNIMGERIQKYDPVLGTYNLLKNDPVIGEKIQGFKSAVAPMPYGTSQKQYNEYQGIVDKFSGIGSFGDLISGIYGQGGIMQGYNPVSAFGRGPIGAIENRISSIMNRTAPMTDFARNQIWGLYDARDQLVGGQGINAVTRPGTYAYDDVIIGGSGTGGDGGSSSSSDNFSSQGFGSEGNTSVSTDFGSFDFSRD